jgi:hypothetical protein
MARLDRLSRLGRLRGLDDGAIPTVHHMRESLGDEHLPAVICDDGLLRGVHHRLNGQPPIDLRR